MKAPDLRANVGDGRMGADIERGQKPGRVCEMWSRSNVSSPSAQQPGTPPPPAQRRGWQPQEDLLTGAGRETGARWREGQRGGAVFAGAPGTGGCTLGESGQRFPGVSSSTGPAAGSVSASALKRGQTPELLALCFCGERGPPPVTFSAHGAGPGPSVP